MKQRCHYLHRLQTWGKFDCTGICHTLIDQTQYLWAFDIGVCSGLSSLAFDHRWFSLASRQMIWLVREPFQPSQQFHVHLLSAWGKSRTKLTYQDSYLLMNVKGSKKSIMLQLATGENVLCSNRYIFTSIFWILSRAFHLYTCCVRIFCFHFFDHTNGRTLSFWDYISWNHFPVLSLNMIIDFYNYSLNQLWCILLSYCLITVQSVFVDSTR